jgi:hypothetical protein
VALAVGAVKKKGFLTTGIQVHTKYIKGKGGRRGRRDRRGEEERMFQ